MILQDTYVAVTILIVLFGLFLIDRILWKSTLFGYVVPHLYTGRLAITTNFFVLVLFMSGSWFYASSMGKIQGQKTIEIGRALQTGFERNRMRVGRRSTRDKFSEVIRKEFAEITGIGTDQICLYRKRYYQVKIPELGIETVGTYTFRTVPKENAPLFELENLVSGNYTGFNEYSGVLLTRKFQRELKGKIPTEITIIDPNLAGEIRVPVVGRLLQNFEDSEDRGLDFIITEEFESALSKSSLDNQGNFSAKTNCVYLVQQGAQTNPESDKWDSLYQIVFNQIDEIEGISVLPPEELLIGDKLQMQSKSIVAIMVQMDKSYEEYDAYDLSDWKSKILGQIRKIAPHNFEVKAPHQVLKPNPLFDYCELVETNELTMINASKSLTAAYRELEEKDSYRLAESEKESVQSKSKLPTLRSSNSDARRLAQYHDSARYNSASEFLENSRAKEKMLDESLYVIIMILLVSLSVFQYLRLSQMSGEIGMLKAMGMNSLTLVFALFLQNLLISVAGLFAGICFAMGTGIFAKIPFVYVDESLKIMFCAYASLSAINCIFLYIFFLNLSPNILINQSN